VDYFRVNLSIGTQEAHISRFITPSPINLISVTFERSEEAAAFLPLAWFGPEVTTDPAYHTQKIALEGLPAAPEVPLSDPALNSLLDTLDNRLASRQPRHRHATTERTGN
jgi:hypothetical protein